MIDFTKFLHFYFCINILISKGIILILEPQRWWSSMTKLYQKAKKPTWNDCISFQIYSKIMKKLRQLKEKQQNDQNK